MVLYQFKCKTCDHEQEVMFPASDYDEIVTEDGLLKYSLCDKCHTKTLYRHITKIPSVMGGTKGYMSIERYMQMNPDQYKRKEAEIMQRQAKRRKDRMSRIDKSPTSQSPEDRHKGYGEGQGETKLPLDD